VHLVAEGDLLLALLDLAGAEDAVELLLELLGGLAREHLEDRPPHDLVAAQALGAGLALAVPDLDTVVAVHDVESERQAVDDEAGEAPVLFDLARLGHHLAGQVLGELERPQIGSEDVADHAERLPLPVALADSRLQQAHVDPGVLEGQPRIPRLVGHGVERDHPEADGSRR
jgi:hypothetical protein